MFERRRTAYNLQRGRSPPCSVTPDNPSSQLIGSKVIIKTADGDYQGVVKHVWGDLDKISLSKVTALPSQKTYFGVHNFFKQDIIKITLVEPGVKEKSEKKSVKNNVKLQPLPLGEINGEGIPDYIDNEEDDVDEDNSVPISHQAAADIGSYSTKGDITWGDDDDDCKGDKAVGPLNMKVPLPGRYCIIDQKNEDYQNCITDLKSSSLLGIAMDCSKGRLENVTLICVSTSTTVYLFDIMSLGASNSLDFGLRTVLESEKITKIAHDCRLLSDYLYHRCKVKLANVFDTQVGDVIIHLKENEKKLPQYCNSLSQCLTKYLKLDAQFLPKDEKFQKNISWWKVRPLPPLCRQNAIRNVTFLHVLREAIIEEIFADLTLGVNIYLNAVRNASKEELALNLGSPHVLPPAMASLTKHGMKFLHHYNFESCLNGNDNLWSSEDLHQNSLTDHNQASDSHHQSVQPSNKGMHRHAETVSSHKHSKQNIIANKSQEIAQGKVLENGVCNVQLSENEPGATANSSFSSDCFKNIKWTSDYKSLPMNKFYPAGKI